MLINEYPDNQELKIQKVDLLRRAEMFNEVIKECSSLFIEEEVLKKYWNLKWTVQSPMTLSVIM